MPVWGSSPAGKIRWFGRVLWPRKSVSVFWWRITRESRSPAKARIRDLGNLRLGSTVRLGNTPANLVQLVHLVRRSSGRNSHRSSSGLSSPARTAPRSTRASRRTQADRHKVRHKVRRTKGHSTRARSTQAVQAVPVLVGRSTWEAGRRRVSLVVPV